MLPVLFSVGPFELRTLSVFLVIAFLTSAFTFWRKGREEHYSEGEFFDGFIMATILGFLAGRIGFVLLNYQRFGFSILQWLDIFAYPGVNGVIALLAATVFLYQFTAKNKWDVYEVLDFWVLALSSGLTLAYIGLFFDGTAVGNATSLPVGMMFPGLLEPHHPVQLYAAVFFLLVTLYLGRVEYRYRTFEWYRFGKKTAQTGFLVSMFLIASALFFFLLSWLKNPTIQIGGINFDRILALVVFVTGLLLLFTRSGRSFFKKRSANTAGSPEA